MNSTPNNERRATASARPDASPRSPGLTFLARFRKRRLVAVFTILLLLIAWQIAVSAGTFASYVLPGPLTVLRQFPQLIAHGFARQSLGTDIVVSVFRVAVGFAGAVLIGVPIGLLMGRVELLFDAIDPLLQFGRPIPPLAYIPLLIVWFGIGELPKILLILVGTLPVIIINTILGVRTTPPQRIRVAQCLGATPFQIFSYVIFPSALPAIFTAMKVGIGFAWTYLVAAELVAADSGLGWLVWQAGQQIQVTIIMQGIIIIGLLGYGMELCIRALERTVVRGGG